LIRFWSFEDVRNRYHEYHNFWSSKQSIVSFAVLFRHPTDSSVEEKSYSYTNVFTNEFKFSAYIFCFLCSYVLYLRSPEKLQYVLLRAKIFFFNYYYLLIDFQSWDLQTIGAADLRYLQCNVVSSSVTESFLFNFSFFFLFLVPACARAVIQSS